MGEAVRVAVVTGGNRGMGLATARALGRLGMKVVLTARDGVKGESAALRLRAEGLDVQSFTLDVTSAAGCVGLARWLADGHGRVDVLVNNAGAIFDPPDPSKPDDASVLKAKPETLMRSFETNTLGAFLVSKALVPLMQKGGYGRVVNVSSGMGQLAEMNGGWPGYRISKTALNALTKLMADELGDGPIKVNSICPGWVRTDMGGPGANRSVEEGIDTTVWAATLPDDGPTGTFLRDREPIAW